MGIIFERQVGCYQFPIVKFPICSGHGICVLDNNGTQVIINEPNIPFSQCICDPGWSGYNDLLDMNTHDCSINGITIQIIWSLILLFATIGIIYIIIRLLQSWKNFQEFENIYEHSIEAQTVQTTVQRKFSIQHSSVLSSHQKLFPIINHIPMKWKRFINWRIVTVCLLSLPVHILFFIMSILRLVHKEMALGVSLPITVLFLLSGILFWIAYRNTSMAWLRVRKKLIKFTDEDQQQAEEATIRLQRMLRIANIPEFIEALCCLLLVFKQDQAPVLIFIFFHATSINLALSFWAYIRAAKCLEKILLQDLEKLQGKQRLEREKALNNIQRLIKEDEQHVFGSIFVPLVYAWWPWLRSVLAYNWITLIWINVALIKRIKILKIPNVRDDENQLIPKTPERKPTVVTPTSLEASRSSGVLIDSGAIEMMPKLSPDRPSLIDVASSHYTPIHQGENSRPSTSHFAFPPIPTTPPTDLPIFNPFQDNKTEV